MKDNRWKYIKRLLAQRGYWPKNYRKNLDTCKSIGLLSKKKAEKMWGKDNIIHIRIEIQELRK